MWSSNVKARLRSGGEVGCGDSAAEATRSSELSSGGLYTFVEMADNPPTHARRSLP